MVSKGFPNITTSSQQYNIGEKPSVFVPFPLSLCMESKYVVRSFFPNGVFLPCDHELDFLHQLM